ncbi:UMP-CMP kinase 2, mitochondrial [Bufo gargarizans]|uniref:UMP-CMP kinase 2, mitochondrial-like n=1 Tax=Bufo gargarizans TaxID=30331 RepID=UPI001CF0E1BB|nr:UMP-CMP kinase 2, mitochondrial-like [Bufo gargarizans]XP_044145130.1 UMP-CMP kinase 2, mitochondrial [Bufo gargarizans]
MLGWRRHRLVLQLYFHIKSGLTNSRRMASSSTDLESQMFAVEPSSYSLSPFYFRTYNGGPPAPSMTPNDWPMLAQGRLAFSVCITKGHRVKTARLHKSLGQELSQQLPGSEILRLISYRPNDLHGSLEKGFFIMPPLCCPDAQKRLCDILREYRKDIQLCSYSEGEEAEIWQYIWEVKGEAKEVARRSPVLRVDEPMSSPFVDSIKGSAVFYALEDACSILKESSAFIPEAQKVLASVEQHRVLERGHFPIIVIEGLDATGKSTLTESLKTHLKAALLKSPPESISHWRTTFDSEPSLIKRAYYAVGNYIGATEIAKTSKTSPVIVDRFWHSTAAYAIATEMGGGIHNLPDHHHDVYHWPEDLLRPDLVILLTVRDEERIRRIRQRGLQETKEEKELEANSMFRQKVEEVYKRMEDPSCVIIDASPSMEMVLQEALSVIKKKCDI